MRKQPKAELNLQHLHLKINVSNLCSAAAMSEVNADGMQMEMCCLSKNTVEALNRQGKVNLPYSKAIHQVRIGKS